MERFPETAWKLLSELIEARCGLVFDGVRKSVLRSRLEARLRYLDLDTLDEYHHLLLTAPDREVEFEHLTQQLTNNETYFFREVSQISSLVEHVAQEQRTRSASLRILSAGCSSGEEPYSIAIRLQEGGPPKLPWSVLGVDIDRERIDRARVGVYQESSLRRCSPRERQDWFQPAEGRFRLNDEARKNVKFRVMNLVDPVPGLGRFEVIFCRNVLIYFGRNAFSSTIELFRTLLTPKGYLFLGHSESLVDSDYGFQPILLGDRVVYQPKR